jgi:hypothetical protein
MTFVLGSATLHTTVGNFFRKSGTNLPAFGSIFSGATTIVVIVGKIVPDFGTSSSR